METRVSISEAQKLSPKTFPNLAVGCIVLTANATPPRSASPPGVDQTKRKETNMLKQFDPRPLYDIYAIAIRLRERLNGGMPRNKELIRAWVESTTGFKDEATEKLIQADADLVVNAVAEKMWIGFPEDAAKGIFIECRQVKAMLKQSASLLGITKKKLGSKQVLAEGMEVKALDGGSRIYLGKMGPDGTEEKAIHVMTAQGPRTALKKTDFINSPELVFELWVLKTATAEKRHVGEDEVTSILQHAQENGLGASRSQGHGKFDVVAFKKLEA